MINGYVMWSVYIRTATIKKMKEEHLPLVASALGEVEFDWVVLQERENPGLVRAVTHQNYSSERIEDIILPVLRGAYTLGDGWKISGLGDLCDGELRHVMGVWDSPKPANKPPALESVVFEIQPGAISGKTNDGWSIAGGGSTVIPSEA